uniref:Uncharacterized protein n=1 Tax=Anopheles stephensi TaxID=30069 RepID=A0A182YMJ8_ANOST
MKFAVAFALIALFAVTLAMPQPEEAAAAASNDGAKATIEVDPALISDIESIVGRAFDWRKWLGIAVKIGQVLVENAK